MQSGMKGLTMANYAAAPSVGDAEHLAVEAMLETTAHEQIAEVIRLEAAINNGNRTRILGCPYGQPAGRRSDRSPGHEP